MGAVQSVFGKISEESPKFTLLKKTCEFEIRKYSKSVAIETYYEADHVLGGQGKSFMNLARYIGVMNKAENEEEKKISMTAPVSMIEVKKGEKFSMRFFLPASYANANEAPKPTKENVKVIDVPERIVAVRTFSGHFRRENIEKNRAELLEALKNDKEVKNVGNDVEVFGWNPPWTLSFLRTNEVLVKCDFVDGKK